MARTRLSRGGDYVPPDANIVARKLFIDAVARLVPTALDTLQVVAMHLPDRTEPGAQWDPQTFALERPLRDWCRTYGFTATSWLRVPTETPGVHEYMAPGHDWLVYLARQTAAWLRRQASQPAEVQKTPAEVLKMCVSGSYAAIDPPLPPRWDVDLETEVAFIKRQAQYRAEVKQRAIAAGRVLARQVNKPQHAARAFEWLARFQVAGVEAAEIRAVSKPRPSVDLIRAEITAAAKQAGVHLRKARRGRPPDV